MSLDEYLRELAASIPAKYERQDRAAMAKLVAALKTKPDTPTRASLIAKAEALEYAEFAGSTLRLIVDLTNAGEEYKDILAKTLKGEYESA